MKDEVISLRVEKIHRELFQKFTPYFGTSEGEVIRNLALRWIETNITNPNIIDLAKRRAIRLDVNGVTKRQKMKKDEVR
jgi:hypothetical protein